MRTLASLRCVLKREEEDSLLGGHSWWGRPLPATSPPPAVITPARGNPSPGERGEAWPPAPSYVMGYRQSNDRQGYV